MTDEFDGLLVCIKADDVRTFQAYEGKYDLPNLRMGRFPVLSVVYLLSAKKIAAYCEERYIRVNTWKEEREPFVLSSVFSKKAGRALRLYVNEVVSPLEMLLLLDKTKRLRALYPLARPSQAQKARLTSVWSVLYSLRVTCLPDRIEIEKRPLSRYERRRLLLSVCSLLLSVAILIATPFCVNIFYPFINVKKTPENQEPGPETDVPGGEDEDQDEDEEIKYYTISSVSEIDFASNNVYTLSQDVLVPEGTYAETMNCTVKGAGYTFVLSSPSLFGTVKGTIENVGFSFEKDCVFSKDTALIASVNEGKLDNVSLSMRGTFGFEKGTADSIIVAGLVSVNQRGAKIVNCDVSCDLVLTGQTEANGTFAGVCGQNNGEVGSCACAGTLSSDRVDLAGICNVNGYYLHDCVNRCSLTQTVSVREWNPICAGIALTNNYSLTICRNEGNIGVSSTYETEGELEENHSFAEALAAGIVAQNTYSVTQCVNVGNVSCSAVENLCYAGGIVAVSSPIIYMPSLENCTNLGKTSVTNKRITALIGGIVAYGSQSYFNTCSNEAEEVVATIQNCSYDNSYVCAGGIGGNASGCTFSSCENRASVRLNAVIETAYVGGMTAFGGTVSNAVNSGDLSVSGTIEKVYVGGIAANTSSGVSSSSCAANMDVHGTIDSAFVGGVLASVSGGAMSSCSFKGDIQAEGRAVDAGGIAASSYFTISSSYASGRITVSGENVRVGGILGYSPVTLQSSRVYCGDADGCLSDVTMEITATDVSFAGGIVGYGSGAQYYRGTEPVYRGASVTNSFFTGTITGETVYIGTIFGGCDEYIFKNMRDDKQNFENDFVLVSSPLAVGAYKPTENEEYLAGDNVSGVTVQTLEEMQANETYASLMETFGK